MARVKLKIAADHYHIFHRVAPTIAKHKGYFEAENLDRDDDRQSAATGTRENSCVGAVDWFKRRR